MKTDPTNRLAHDQSSFEREQEIRGDKDRVVKISLNRKSLETVKQLLRRFFRG